MSEILHLNVFKKWFDMAEQEIKTEDYREITPYWCQKLLLYDGEKKTMKFWLIYLLEESIKNDGVSFRKYDSIIYKNGYARKGKPAPQIEFKFSGIKTGHGNTAWGFIKGHNCFVIKLQDKK